MAQIILSQVGAAAGARFLPKGLSLFGRTITGAGLGRALGGLAGQAIDASLSGAAEGPRLTSMHIMESREGAGLPIIYGRMRVPGQVIWASDFRETRREERAGKGGPKLARYSYSVSFAVAICKGPIHRIDKVWANGRPVPLEQLNGRIYYGTSDQSPDALLQAAAGNRQAPAYRDTAYIVFEDMPLDDFGQHLPQLSFEVIGSGTAPSDELRQQVRGMNIIPASGEFVYATDIVRETRFPNHQRPLNMNNNQARADFAVSLAQLQDDLPAIGDINLTVAWFGTDLRAGHCKIYPAVETRQRKTTPFSWSVGDTSRDSAYLISTSAGISNYGGTPADEAVLQGLQAIHAAGISVTLSPFLLMDIPSDNQLIDFSGKPGQPAFPWRGRIRATPDSALDITAQIDAFMGQDGAFGYRHFILHYARLAARAKTVSSFLIGSELRGLTRLQADDGSFPFVSALIKLAGEVRSIVGPDIKISYAADWSEYGAYLPDDSPDVLFPLDPLWASPDIDYVGIDWYPPMGDWRPGHDHLDAQSGYEAADDPDYLRANITGGENYDWFYQTAIDREAQVRTSIIDHGYAEEWVFRQKDLSGWWSNLHFERPSGIRSTIPTAWRPGMKPIRLAEIGFPAIDHGTNQPNVFYDPKSSESALPVYSLGHRDDLLQRRALVSALSYWQAQAMIEAVSVWCWDARPWPAFPQLESVWADGGNWAFGHWLNGRAGLVELATILTDIGDYSQLSFDVSGVDGLVEGYAIGGVSTLRQAMAPLMAAFDLNCIEISDGLAVRRNGAGSGVAFQLADVVQGGISRQHQMLDKAPKAVRLNYISGDGSYAPAVTEVRRKVGAIDHVETLSLPLVMGESRARNIAGRLLSDLQRPISASVIVGPQSFVLQPGDEVEFAGQGKWRVEYVTDTGLTRKLDLSPARRPALPSRNSTVPAAGPVTTIAAEPILIMIDAPAIAGHPAALLLACAADPWPEYVVVSAGADASSMIERAVFDTPSHIGRVMSAAGAGPVGRWDHFTVLTVETDNQPFNTISDAGLLAGGNQLLVQSAHGWELLAFAKAVLIGPNQWQLSRLLRGLGGSQSVDIPGGAQIVIVDERLRRPELALDETGVELSWRPGGGTAQTYQYQAKAAGPWPVGHLQAQRQNSGFKLSWSARAPDISNHLDRDGSAYQGVYHVRLYRYGQLHENHIVRQTHLWVSPGYDLAEIAEIDINGSFGPWGSIPLPAV